MKKLLYDRIYECQKDHWWYEGRKNIACSLLDKYVDKDNQNKIIDIGCGSGAMLNSLKEYGQVTGLDSYDMAIDMSKSVFDGEIIKADLFDIKDVVDEKKYNCITLMDVIEHLEDDKSISQIIEELLCEDGICLLTVPAYQFLWSNHDIVNEHKRRYTRKSLENLFDKSIFKIEKVSYYNFLLFFPILLIRKFKNSFHIKEKIDLKMPNKFLNEILKYMFTIEKNILRYTEMPFGVSIIMVIRKLRD